MKKILLLSFPTGFVGGRSDWPDVNTIDVIRGATESSPEQGFTIAELRQIIHIQETAEAYTNFFVLSFQDFEYLKTRINAHKWPVASKGILLAATAIQNSVDYDPASDEKPIPVFTGEDVKAAE